MNDPSNGQSIAMAAIARRLDTRILSRGRVVVVGAGGVGSYLLQPLTVFLAALARSVPIRLVICDGDAFTPDNAYRTDIPEFANKAAAWVSEICRKFPVPDLNVRGVPQYVTTQNCSDVLREGDCCLLCCDNHATRKLVSDRLRELKNGILISGGNDGVNDTQTGTAGNVQVYVRAAGRDHSGAPLDLFHPEIASPADRNPDELDCLELAVAGEPQLAFANFAVASAMCNALLRLLMPPAGERMYDETCFDVVAGISAPQWLTGPRVAAAEKPADRARQTRRQRSRSSPRAASRGVSGG